MHNLYAETPHLRELSLFTGAGGGVLGTSLLGWRHIGYVEYNPYCQRVLHARIQDGLIDDAPIFGDIRQFNKEGHAEAYAGHTDVISAGFP
jgi:DNA (cytosine-5)-methyltransferase 1